MNRLLAAVAGGVAGTAVLSLLLVLLEVETRSAIQVFAVIARFVGTPGDQAVGFAIFAGAGVLAWPLVFVAVEDALPFGRDPASRTTALAVPLWAAFVVVGRGDLHGPVLVVFVGYTLIAHLAYGFVVGAVYARLAGDVTDVREPASRGW